MAQEVQLEPGSIEKRAKIRHPAAVVVLSLITIGIYYLYWWYQVNRELRDLGRARSWDGLGEKPLNSLLAFFPGGLIIVPPYVSLYNACKRFTRAQEKTLGEVTFNGWIVLILLLVAVIIGFTGLLVPGYIQSELNKVWEGIEGQGPEATIDAQDPEPAPGAQASEPKPQ